MPEENSNEVAEKHISSNVCDVCLGDNLLKAVGVATCNRCNNPFCIHFASKIDIQYCVDCMSDISLRVENVSKVYEHYNEVTNIVSRYSRRARSIKMEGQDWLFAQRKIKTLSDAELAMQIEYHRTSLQLLLVESEERKAAAMQRYAGVKIQSPASSVITTVTSTKKVTEAKSTKQSAQLSSLLSSMLAKGMTMDQITAMLKGK